MWQTWLNKLKIDDAQRLRAYQRLMLALFLSVILHAILFGGIHISLPSFKTPTQVLEARLVLPKKVPQQPPVLQPKPEPEREVPSQSPKEPEPVEAAPPVPELPLPKPAPEPIAEPVPAPVPESAPEQVPEPVTDVPAANAEPIIQEPLVLNPNAYRYVETHYSVSTKIDGPSQGKSTIVFDLNDQDAYALTWKTEPSGLVAMFVDDLLQTSKGKLSTRGLQPSEYVYQYGDKPDKTNIASFDWPTRKVSLRTAKETKVVDLPNDTQDILSFMYQFMYVAPLEVMQMHIVTGKNLRDYQYVFEGEETIKTALGEIKTVHIGRTGDDGDSKAELWLAVEYQNLPVKIRKTEKNGKVYEFVVNRIVTTKPPPIVP